jgi:hydrogenase nickel incorporation protein HypA/HybF
MTSLVERVCEVARAEGAGKITAIHVVCGELSGVIPEALTFCFDVCTAGTCAEGSELHIHTERAIWCCSQCGAEIDDLEEPALPVCPSCHATTLEIAAGRVFRLESIEVV